MAAQVPQKSSGINFIDLRQEYESHAEEFDAAMKRVCSTARFVLGPEVTTLEECLAKYVHVKHCITVGNGTIALQIALQALGVGSSGSPIDDNNARDEVITTPFTWISTPHAISLVGARPVFVDIDPVSYNIDVNKLEQAITSRTRAILPVSLFGQMPDIAKINAIAARHGIAVVEDAAQSFGALQNGKYAHIFSRCT